MRFIGLIGVGAAALLLAGCAATSIQAVPVKQAKNECTFIERRSFWSDVVAVPCFDKHGEMVHVATASGSSPASVAGEIAAGASVGAGVGYAARSLKIPQTLSVSVPRLP